MFTLLANSATVFDAPSTPFRIKFDILQAMVRFEDDFVGVQVREAHTVCGSLFGPLVQLVDVALKLVAALHGRSGGKWPTLNRKNRVYRLVLGVSSETSERNARFLKSVLCSECRHNRLNAQRQKKHETRKNGRATEGRARCDLDKVFFFVVPNVSPDTELVVRKQGRFLHYRLGRDRCSRPVCLVG